MVNRVRVSIGGTTYGIATTDSEEYITTLAEKLDGDIRKLMEENDSVSVTKAAVFTAMDYLDEYLKSAGSVENMRNQIQEYIADATQARLETDKVKAECEMLKKELSSLMAKQLKVQHK